MPNQDASNNQPTVIFRLAIWILSQLANPSYRDELIGDIQEEYTDRNQAGQNANYWLFRQTVLAIWDGQKAMVKSTSFVKIFSVFLCVLAMPTIALLVSWLSNFEEVSDQLWTLLLSAELHSIIFDTEFWALVSGTKIISDIEPMMFLNIPSLLWALIFVCSNYWVFKRYSPSIWIFSTLSLALIVLPYLFGFTLINILEPDARKVGPTIAFMVLAPFYTLPLYVYFLFKEYKK